MVVSLVADYTYVVKQTFARSEVFAAYAGLLALRSILPFVIGCKNVYSKVCSSKANALPPLIYEGEDLKTAIRFQDSHTKSGVYLYSILPFAYFTGSYRLLNFRHFSGEIGSGLAFDLFLNALPLLLLQGFNNFEVA